MRRLAIIATLLGALVVSAVPASGQYIYRRPIGPARAAIRAALPPYGYYYGPRYYYRPYYYGGYYGPYWGPSWSGYYWW